MAVKTVSGTKKKSPAKEVKKELNDIKPKSSKYKCICCGNEYNGVVGNFIKSQSQLHNGYGKYLPICNHCIEQLYQQYTESTGSEDDAMRRLCLHLDLYVDERQLVLSKTGKTGIERLKAYVKNIMTHFPNKTYDTYLREQHISKTEEAIKNKFEVTDAILSRWGVGIGDDEDYCTLEEHYKMLKQSNPNCDNNQEIFIKSLCNLYLLQTKALRTENTDAYLKANAEYNRTFTTAGLKTYEETKSNDGENLGKWVEIISRYTPEEYYKDKKLYRDFDGLGEYFSRFILRPLKNLILGTNERDEEFCVKDENDGKE